MKPLFLFSVFVFFSQSLQAQGEPLRVAVDPLNPPFVMQGANNQFSGFDISMMQYICQTLKRTCQFIPIHFDKIIDAVSTEQVDVASSSITITPERAAIVNFSLPYLLSEARFIGPNQLATTPFKLKMLNGRKIGVSEGSIFPDVIKKLAVKDPNIITYTSLNNLMDDLYQGNIDFGLMDDPAALYWQAQSSRKLAVLGKSFNYGVGLGIALNKNNTELLQLLNQALLQYQNSDEFKQSYQTYMVDFK